MEELLKGSAMAMAAAVVAGNVSASELIDAHIERIERLDPDVNAVVVPDFERAREAARRADTAGPADRGPLHGLPFTVKECIEVAGLACTDGSRLFEGNVSALTAVVVERMRAAGAILLGKTNIPEFAFHYDSNNLVYGATRNPHDRARSAGGSSGGEAAALASCMTPLGIGSDYGGSVRVPSHFCGTVGLRTGRHLVPYHGHFPVPRVPTIDLWSTIGPMARYVEDLEMLMPILAAPDPALEPGVPPLAYSGAEAPRRIAYFEDDGLAPVSTDCRQAARNARDALVSAGFELVESQPPSQAEVREVFLDLALAEVRVGLEPLFADRVEDLSPQIRYNLARLADIQPTLAQFVGHFTQLFEMERRAAGWLEEHPIAICPVTSTPAFEIGADSLECDGRTVDVIDTTSLCTYANALGLPAASVPAHRTDSGLPVGVQIIGRRWRESEVLAVARVLEEALGGWLSPATAQALP